MGKAEQTTETILSAAEALILESGGDAQRVTIRQVADRAEVSVGLVNYYFASKEKLIEACVQRMIGGVVSAFRPNLPLEATRAERLGSTAAQVAAFLDQHAQISRISILSDMNAPGAKDNTMGTTRGFCNTIGAEARDQDAMLRAFCLTAILQSVFLRRDVLLESLGVDWDDAQQRDALFLRVSEWILS